ncbi:hypothetical protein, partial [Methylobacterium sp. J-070]|uniref:hypothetical protein n=1 Tax=Methylobacterium sp. J-070 TaxID=2836650 RepID=UPI001FB868CA
MAAAPPVWTVFSGKGQRASSAFSALTPKRAGADPAPAPAPPPDLDALAAAARAEADAVGSLPRNDPEDLTDLRVHDEAPWFKRSDACQIGGVRPSWTRVG